MNIGLMAADLSLGRSMALTTPTNDVEDEGDQQSTVIIQKQTTDQQTSCSEIMNLESTTANSSTVAGHGSSTDTDLALHGGSAGQMLPDLQALEVYHKALEEERNKIQAFERELPFCMQLLEDAIEASRERLEDRLSCKLNTVSTTVPKSHHNLHKLNFISNTSTAAVDVLGSNPAKRKWPSSPAPATAPAKLAPPDADDPADLHLHIYQRPPKWPNPNFPVDLHLSAQAMKTGSIKLQEFVKKTDHGVINDQAMMLGERLGSVINSNYNINQDVKPNILFTAATDHHHHHLQHHQSVIGPAAAINARINNISAAKDNQQISSYLSSNINCNPGVVNSRSAHIIDLEKEHHQQQQQHNYHTALMVAETAAAFNARAAINAVACNTNNNKNNGNGNSNALQSSTCSAFSRPTISISNQFCKEIAGPGAMPTCTLSPLSSSKTCTSGGGGGSVGGPATPLVQSVQRKPRRCWSPELHQRFLNALNHLGGCQVATPKQIREFMNVEGLTNDEVKSHLQKFRLHMRRPNNVATSGQMESPPSQTGGPNGHHLVVFGHLWVPPTSDATNDQQAPRSMNTTTTITSNNEQASTAIELCAKNFNHVGTSNALTTNNLVNTSTRATTPLIRLCQPNYNNVSTTPSLRIQPLDDNVDSPSHSSPANGVHLQLLHTNTPQKHDLTHSNSNHENLRLDANRPHATDTSIDLTIACNSNNDIPIHHHENITNNATHIREASACS